MILRVRAKESKHITIYENDAGDFVYSNQIYAENHLSAAFSKCMEQWFQLAFEWNPKQRGYVFERITNAADSELADSPPVHVLKFFQSIDLMLQKKILTIFVLTNHMNVSMEIDENTTNDDLFAFIEHNAQIPKSKCHVIKATENGSIDADLTIRKFSKPIDLYVDGGGYDKPMVFVLQIGGIGPSAVAVAATASFDKSDNDDVSMAIVMPDSVRKSTI